MLNKENAGLALSKGTKWPLWVPEFNLLLAVSGDMWRPLFAPAGGRQKGTREGKWGEGYIT